MEKIDSYAEIIDVLSDTATKMKHTAAVLEQVRRTHAEAIHLIDTTVAPAIWAAGETVEKLMGGCHTLVAANLHGQKVLRGEMDIALQKIQANNEGKKYHIS